MEYSKEKLSALEKALEEAAEFKKIPEFTIYAVGSFGRHEGGENSDIDTFFISNAADLHQQRLGLAKIQMFSKFIEIAEGLDFPEVSNDGQFLEVLSSHEMLGKFGAPEDDYANLFTARMLLLLESKPIFGKQEYKKLLKSVIDTYFRDFKGHEKNFHPTILLNDIVRYWKTLCLNYENKRLVSDSRNPEEKQKFKIKNLKLKFSRVVTCYSTIAIVCKQGNSLNPEKFQEICELTPIQRLEGACEARQFETLKQQYVEFLDIVHRRDEEIVQLIEDNEDEINKKADQFLRTMSGMIKITAEQNDFLRYLLI